MGLFGSSQLRLEFSLGLSQAFEPPCVVAEEKPFEAVTSSSNPTLTPRGVHHVRCVESKKLDQTGGDGDSKRGIRQGQGRARAIRADFSQNSHELWLLNPCENHPRKRRALL